MTEEMNATITNSANLLEKMFEYQEIFAKVLGALEPHLNDVKKALGMEIKDSKAKSAPPKQ